jgi:hypothetical protein
MKLLAILAALAVSASAFAGDFKLIEEDAGMIEVHYTGGVEDYDVYQWNSTVEYANGRVIYLTIDSPGGSAYGGVDLYWAMEAYPYLVTIAGGDFGAYSAAAIMWLAGDERRIAERGGVYFHAAFCSWDPKPNPSIGCNTVPFQDVLIPVLKDAGLKGSLFNTVLNQVQALNGTDGWITITNDGWFMVDTTEWTWLVFNYAWLLTEGKELT